MSLSHSSLKHHVQRILTEAATFLRPQFGLPIQTTQKTMSASSVVTELDRATEVLIREKLMRIDSTIPVVGEEFGGDSKAEQFWLLDPIDGTGQFIRGIPCCTIMLALIRDGDVVLSFIFDIMANRLFVAEKGKGATCNHRPIHVSQRSLSQAYVCWEMNLNNSENLKRFLELQRQVSLIKTQNCGWEFSMIASGVFEGRVCVSPMEHDWDYAPGALLVAEAGGVVKNIGSDKYDFRNHDFVATNSVIYDQICGLLESDMGICGE